MYELLVKYLGLLHSYGWISMQEYKEGCYAIMDIGSLLGVLVA